MITCLLGDMIISYDNVSSGPYYLSVYTMFFCLSDYQSRYFKPMSPFQATEAQNKNKTTCPVPGASGAVRPRLQLKKIPRKMGVRYHRWQ